MYHTESSEEKPHERNDEHVNLSLLKEDGVRAAINTLSRFVTPQRMDKLQAVLGNRTQHVTFVFENPSNPNNVWACLR